MLDVKLSYEVCSVARFFMAICVFFCHVFQQFNKFGFLFVGLFFFLSGYAMESYDKRKTALIRLIPYLKYFIWFSLLYFLFFGVYPYPSSWFLVVYFLLMLFYRVFRSYEFMIISFIFLFYFFSFLGMVGWSSSFGGFLFGMFFSRFPFSLKNVMLFLPLSLLLFFRIEIGFWAFIPLFSWLVLSFSSLPVFRSIAFLGGYTFYFYCVHCFVLGLFGATWTLGGSPSFMPCLGAFCVSVVVSVFMKDYLFNYPKIQKAG